MEKLNIKGDWILFKFSKTVSTFQELLHKDSSFSIDTRNTQTLATKIYKVANHLSPQITNEVFAFQMKKSAMA